MDSTHKEIEMNENVRINNSNRSIREKFLDDDENNLYDAKRRQRIFDEESYPVMPMIDPKQYLPNTRSENREDNFVEMTHHCCGQMLLKCSFLCACCCCKCCLYELPTSQAGLVERFGKFSRLLTPGFNLVNPCSEEVHEVDMKIRVLNAGVTDAITKDNVELKIFSSVAFRVVNPIIAFYQTGVNLDRVISELVTSSFRNTLGVYNMQEALTDRIKIIREVKDYVTQNMPVGIFVENVFLEDIRIPPNIERDLSSVAKERRIAEASIIDSQADVKSADLMRETAELLDTKAAMQIRYLQMVQAIGNRGGVTVLMEIGVNKKGYKEDPGHIPREDE